MDGAAGDIDPPPIIGDGGDRPDRPPGNIDGAGLARDDVLEAPAGLQVEGAIGRKAPLVTAGAGAVRKWGVGRERL